MIRRTIALALLALTPIALAGCSVQSEGPAAASGETRAVTGADGAVVEVPEEPERIVALSEPTLDGLVALGVEPVGTVSGRGQSTVPSYLEDRAGEVPILGGVAQPNFEAIGEAKPDLILVDGTSINNNPEAMEVLNRIAPVVYTGNAGGNWRDNFSLVAEAVGRAEAGETVLAEYDAHVQTIAEELTEYADETFSIVRWQGSSAALILNELPPGQALIDLGLQRPAHQDREGRGHSEPVSLENLADIDADYMFFGTLGGSSVGNPSAGGSADVSGAELALDEAIATPGFTDLEAYRNGRIILVDGSSWTSTGGPILMTEVVDAVAEAL